MSKRNKRREALERNPRAVRPEDLDAVLRAGGFIVRQQSGSHRIYVREKQVISVPQRHPFLLPTYVRQALALLGSEDEDE